MTACAICAAVFWCLPGVAADDTATRVDGKESAAPESRGIGQEAGDAVRDAGDAAHDASITARLETMYLLNEHLNPFRINTTTKDGVVTLTGTVDDAIEKDLAEALAKSIDAVSKVDNQLTIERRATPEVDRSSTAVRTRVEDANITAAVRRRIAYNNMLDDANIGVDVKDQAVRLYGTVPSEAAREEAVAVAEDTRGVLEVRNDLVVEEKPRSEVADADTTAADRDNESVTEEIKETAEEVGDTISDEWIEKRVEAQLAWNRNVSLMNLDVEVQDGIAKLSGRVISEEQKDLAGAIASRTSGVSDVQNDIEVRGIRTSKNN
jgi:osmotically-inducible protein OsmY